MNEDNLTKQVIDTLEKEAEEEDKIINEWAQSNQVSS